MLFFYKAYLFTANRQPPYSSVPVTFLKNNFKIYCGLKIILYLCSE